MTRKDYEAFARMFASLAPLPSDTIARSTWWSLVQESAQVFAYDNVRFDRARYFRACGMLVSEHEDVRSQMREIETRSKPRTFV